MIEWPGNPKNYHRFAGPEVPFKITAIHEESQLDEKPRASYTDYDLTWNQLALLSRRQKEQLETWRGIYYIFDVSDGRGYVGKASGKQNLLGRWVNYRDKGDGGNRKLRGRDPVNLRFSILELVPKGTDDVKIEEREQNWMIRLRTRSRTHGLNLPELDY